MFKHSFVIAVLSSLLLASCGNESPNPQPPPPQPQVDNTAPVISLIGDESITVEWFSEYEEQGASATDNIDGDVEVTVSGEVIPEILGDYVITYSATDTSGNSSSINRNVTVKPPTLELKEVRFDVSILEDEIPLDGYVFSTAVTEATRGGEIWPPLEVPLVDAGALFFVSDPEDETVLISYHPRTELDAFGEVAVSLKSIADGLLVVNAIAVSYPIEQRIALMEMARDHSDYQVLMDTIESAISTRPTNIFEQGNSDSLFEIPLAILEDVIRDSAGSQFPANKSTSSGLNNTTNKADIGNIDQFHLRDDAGLDFTYVNPTMVYYGVELDGVANLVVPGRKAAWSLPSSNNTKNIERLASLDDGQYDFRFVKWELPISSTVAALGTRSNGLYSLCLGIDLFLICPLSNDQIARWVLTTESSGGQGTLGEVVSQIIDAIGGIKTIQLLDIVLERLSTLTGKNDTETYFNVAVKSLFDVDLRKNPVRKPFQRIKKIINFSQNAWLKRSVKVYSASQRHIPFAFDLLTEPPSIEFCVSSEEGVLSKTCEASNPIASFTISHDSNNPTPGQSITFDASSSTDENYTISQLEFRWDFDGNGLFDTEWTVSEPTSTYVFSESGIYEPVLAVKNPDNQEGIAIGAIEIRDSFEGEWSAKSDITYSGRTDVCRSGTATFELQNMVVTKIDDNIFEIFGGRTTFNEAIRGSLENNKVTFIGEAEVPRQSGYNVFYDLTIILEGNELSGTRDARDTRPPIDGEEVVCFNNEILYGEKL